MVVFNYTGRELSGKIVYYGPALSGKTTNLEQIYGTTPAETRGKMVSMKTKAERTLFFDLLPISRGTIGDFKVRFLLYTVPGQVYYNATRKLVLKGADAIVFVADSQRSQLAANIDSLRNLRTNLLEYGMCLDDLPWIICYNKRDMPDAMPVEELERELNPYGVPSFCQVAMNGEGVFEGFEAIGEMLMERLEKQLKGDKGDKGEPTKKAAPPRTGAGAPAVDPRAVQDVRSAIKSGVPAPPPIPPLAKPAAPAPSSSDSLVISRGLTPAQAGAPAAAPAPPARAPGVQPPIVVQQQLIVPISSADLANKREIRIVIDVKLDPQG